MEIEKVDLHNSCRGCLSSGDDLELIFECFYQDISLAQILMNCIPIFISESDGLSAKICELCRAKATESHEFQQMFINSEREMRDLLENQIIEEDLTEFHVKQEQEEVEAEADSIISESNFEHILVEQVTYGDSEDEKPLIKTTKKRKLKMILPDTEEEEEDVKPPKKKLTPRKFTPKANDSNETFNCPDCAKQFNFEKTLKRHSVIHSDMMLKSKLDREPTDLFTCVICSTGIEGYNQLFAHMRSEHRGNPDQQYECTICNKAYVGMKSMIRHAKMHEENATHECIVCSKRLGMGDDLIDHMLRHEGYKPFKCTRCEKTFLKQNKLQAHILSHMRKDALSKNENQEEPTETELSLLPIPSHLCPECGNEFATKECLKRHLIRHTGIKNFACQHCPSKFFLKSGLTNHMFVHTKLKTHPCDYEGCTKAFTNSQCLKKHKRTHTGERPFACEVCNKRFQVAYHLRRHFLIHTGEKPYACKYCDRAYSQSNDLVKHTKTHIGENTYKCNQCEEMFPKYGLLKEHEFTHYNAEFGV